MAFVTVAGRLLASHFRAGGEVPLTGQIFFTPTMEKVPTGEGVHLPAAMSVELDGDGRFEVELLSAGFSWEVAFSLRHAGAFVPVDCFNFLPEPGVERINFADIVPLTDPVTGVPMLRGEDGVGLEAITTEGGELIFTLTDGSESRIPVPQGIPGTGVAGISLEGDELVFTLTDGSETRLPEPVGADGQDGDDGADGVGISTIILEDGELVIALTDGAETRLPAPKGDPGKDGTSPPPPTLRVGEVQTLPTGSAATAEITGEAPDYTLTLGVPQGPQGDAGKDASIQDTGWRNIKAEIAPPTQFPPEAIFTIKRRDDQVFFQVAIPESASSGLTAASWGAFGKFMPPGFRPRWGGSVTLQGRDATVAHIIVRTTGQIVLSGQGLDKSYGVHACGVWPTADAWPAILPGTPA